MIVTRNQIKVKPATESEKILVAYFSYSGNTRKIARQIQKQIGGDIFKIQSATNYPVNYNELLVQAKQEIESGTKPLLRGKVNNMDNYKVIFIGYPNWWHTFPAPVLTFLTEYDFTDKTIIPFCTHGGGGLGRSHSDIQRKSPSSKVLNAFAINGSYVKENNTEVLQWVSNIKNTIYA